MDDSYRLIGNIGSPYSMKMRALMRYRRIPFVWVNRDRKVNEEIAHVKPPVIPVLQYPEDGSYHVDSTPMAYELERRHHPLPGSGGSALSGAKRALDGPVWLCAIPLILLLIAIVLWISKRRRADDEVEVEDDESGTQEA